MESHLIQFVNSELNTTWSSVNWLLKQPWYAPLVNLLTLLILASTAILALFTSKAASDANKLKLLPLLCIYFHKKRGYPQSDNSAFFTIKNLGEGVAHSIVIDRWILILQDFQTVIEFNMTIPGTNVLSKGEEVEIQLEVKENGKKTSLSGDFAISMMRYTNRVGLQIHCKDATGKNCVCLVKFNETQVNIAKPTYRPSIISSAYIWFELNVKLYFKLWFERLIWRYEKPQILPVPPYWKRILRFLIALVTSKKKTVK